MRVLPASEEMDPAERVHLATALRRRRDQLQCEIGLIDARLAVLEGPDELEAERLPPELLLRVADFVNPKSRTMLEFSMCSKGTIHLLAPRLATSFAVKDLLPPSRVKRSLESHAMTRIEALSLEPPDVKYAGECLLRISEATITSLSVTAVNIWQIMEHVRAARLLPNLRSFAVQLRESVALFPDVPMDSFIYPPDLPVTELVMTGYYNSPILNGLVRICPQLKGITVDVGEDFFPEYYDDAASWTFWDGTGLTDHTLSLIRRFGSLTWSHLAELCERPPFRPRDLRVFHWDSDHFAAPREEDWELLASMPDLETVHLERLPTDLLAFGLIGQKSFRVTSLLMNLESSDFDEVLGALRDAPHETIHLGFYTGEQFVEVDSDGDEVLEFSPRRRPEAAFWKRAQMELGSKITFDYNNGSQDAETFWADWEV